MKQKKDIRQKLRKPGLGYRAVVESLPSLISRFNPQDEEEKKNTSKSE
jgi:hypothetical protein